MTEHDQLARSAGARSSTAPGSRTGRAAESVPPPPSRRSPWDPRSSAKVAEEAYDHEHHDRHLGLLASPGPCCTSSRSRHTRSDRAGTENEEQQEHEQQHRRSSPADWKRDRAPERATPERAQDRAPDSSEHMPAVRPRCRAGAGSPADPDHLAEHHLERGQARDQDLDDPVRSSPRSPTSSPGSRTAAAPCRG